MSDKFTESVMTLAYNHCELFAWYWSIDRVRDHLSTHHGVPTDGDRAANIREHRRAHKRERRARR